MMTEKLISILDTSHKEIWSSSKEKILIGSDPHCDWVLTHPSISRHHAFLVKTLDGWRLMDLYSTSGVFLNGERIKEVLILDKQIFTVGALSFTLEDISAQQVNIDSSLDQTHTLEFDENYLAPEISLNDLLHSTNEEPVDALDESLNIISASSKNRLEVCVYSSGSVISIDYFEWPSSQVRFSHHPKSGEVFCPGLKEDVIFEFNDKNIKFTGTIQTSEKNLLLGTRPIFFYQSNHQISFRLVEKHYKSKILPWWVREKEHYQNLAKAIPGLFLPFLLLLFVSLPVIEDEKEVTIVYQEIAPKVEEKVTNAETPTEVKPMEQEKAPVEKKDNQKIAMSKAKSQSNQLENPSPDVQNEPTPQPKKTFSFKSSTSVNPTVVDGTVSLNKTSSSSSSDSSADTSGITAKVGGGASDGELRGFDTEGRSAASLGSRGLVKKKGFDHSYIEPKTVVLGSMDPELLRKILQEYLPQFRHCYQQELSRNDGIKGVLDLNFTISPDGRVSKTNVKAKDARFSSKGIGCMEQVLSIIVFPKPKGGGVVDVKQPLNFLSETEKI